MVAHRLHGSFYVSVTQIFYKRHVRINNKGIKSGKNSNYAEKHDKALSALCGLFLLFDFAYPVLRRSDVNSLANRLRLYARRSFGRSGFFGAGLAFACAGAAVCLVDFELNIFMGDAFFLLG